ncbi:hypothetical DNA repair proteins [Pelotomaculum thermopropionicum SI]|uniref:Hypothetical DNA repair proteins n=1 Tax=Pelotomaculum thermopropionicum (strain DSM 13744 / JCM 10971 / SI) TaxID=370438 RepID=A5CZE2_PELTS|nr:hypothetical DNA repair proteins [Pelotomaculum thermopropionicum SI]
MSLKIVKEASVLYAARRISSPDDAAGFVRDFIEDADREKFLIICLNTRNEPTAVHTVAVGTLNSSQVHPREVFKVALLANSAGIILAHNHPSGDPAPSREDIEITRRLKECGDLLGISVLDHIVIGSGGQYTSLLQKLLI